MSKQEEKQLADFDPARVISPMYEVELMLCWDDHTWSDGEYIYVSTFVEQSKVEETAIKVYQDYLKAFPNARQPFHMGVYSWGVKVYKSEEFDY